MKRKVASKPALTAAPERRIEVLKISEIARRPQFQVRKHGTYSETVREYADKIQAGIEFPPVKIADIKGVLTLVDG